MKIAVIRRECGHSWGGAERYCAQVVRVLSGFGHQITLIARRANNLPEGVNFVPLNYRARGSVLKNYLFLSRAKRALAGRGFDVVYGLSRVYPLDVFRISDPLHASWLARRHRQRGLRRLFSLSLRHRLLLSLEKTLMSDPRVKIVANSRLVASEVERFYGLCPSSSRLKVIYNGVDLRQFNPEVRRQGKELRQRLGLEKGTVFLFSAAEPKRKGLETLIKALASLGRQEFCLLAVGLTRDRVPWRLPASLQGRLHFLGRVARPEIYYGAADLLVLPSQYDPFANVCLEAMACATPVLTTSANGASEVIAPGETGFIMKDPRSHRELRERLEQFLNLSEEKRLLMGEQAAEQAGAYTWEKHAENLLEFFGAN